ncbi:uncharacterized protein LOC108905515 [Anoplophora glabripennis]|uniref:uncharacterized protein LOC108905515 n=1 Tax=Anoplophora glabripennis TaxID=217634 RepID=UPI000873EECC|nr:uncharacterized protein LOC108905515 [Anoplophora glabripennis]
MLKRRRNRRNRKGRGRKSVSNEENSIAPPSCEVMRACCGDNSFNRSKPLSQLELVTPLKNSNTELFEDDLSPVWATPVNKSRSMIRLEGKKYSSTSFFSSDLFQQKSSTPVEKFNQDNSILDNVKEPLIRVLTEAPELDLNLNLNESPLSEKVLNKEDNLKIQTRIFSKRHSLTYSKLNSIRRSSVDSVESVSRHIRGGIGEKLLTRLKKYTRTSQRWSVKVVHLCTQLGVQLKNSLSSMCNVYNEKSMLQSSETPICKCEEYTEVISGLNVKMEELTEEIRFVKSQLEKEKSNKDNIETISQELNKVILIQFYYNNGQRGITSI